MKSLIFATSIVFSHSVLAESPTTLDIYGYGLSKHFVECKSKCNSREFNEVNSGVALGVTEQFSRWEGSVRVGWYKDSYGSRANHLLFGGQRILLQKKNFHVKAGFLVGYVNGSDFDEKTSSAAILPVVSIGYNLIRVEATGTTEVIAGWLKVSYPF